MGMVRSCMFSPSGRNTLVLMCESLRRMVVWRKSPFLPVYTRHGGLQRFQDGLQRNSFRTSTSTTTSTGVAQRVHTMHNVFIDTFKRGTHSRIGPTELLNKPCSPFSSSYASFLFPGQHQGKSLPRHVLPVRAVRSWALWPIRALTLRRRCSSFHCHHDVKLLRACIYWSQQPWVLDSFTPWCEWP